MKSRFLITIPAIIAISILAVFVFDSVNLDKLCKDSGGKRNGDICIIQEIQESDESIPEQIESVNFDNIFTMKPDSVEFFYYPNSAKDKDTYRLFMLIRLPEWIGGAVNDISAFRAYSAKSLDDACIVKYWPGDGRQRIENPCQGAMYRMVDGAMTNGLIPRSIPMTALPHLDLSADENGFLYVEPPRWTKSENGVIGYGREISFDDFNSGSKFLVDSFAKTHPDYPQIPMEFAGYDLSEISFEEYRVNISYLDFPDNSGRISMSISKSSVGTGYTNLTKSNSESWQIGDNTIIMIGGDALDKNSNVSEKFRAYEIRFIHDGFHYVVNGKELEPMKKDIVRNYFPEYKYDDLFLISSTVK